ncbi:MAG TPA: YdjY domain-containing protein [Tepidisphaeraceae bacterium]|nr:YdjY domain-containing protein [Tepidisphaeraceae bacterium]
MRVIHLLALIVSLAGFTPALFADGKIGKLPHVEFDVEHRQVRVDCEALNVDAPLEFFCCVSGTNEHESVLRTPAKPSDIQIGLLAIGLKPGKPITYSEALMKWLPPQGPPLHISVQFEKDGKKITYPANRWLRNLKTKKVADAFTWVYTGSRTENGIFGADTTGYVVSIVNFDYTLIDIPELKSSDNTTLEWERNAALMPKVGTKVTMIIEPVGADEKKDAAPGSTGSPQDAKTPAKPAAPASPPPAATPGSTSTLEKK